MKNGVKYYIITLKNIFLDNSNSDIHFGVFENGKYFDLLTNKEIYMVDNGFLTKDEFIKSNCKLIGIKKEECGSDKVSIFLKFITESAKNILIEEVNNMEKSINDSVMNDNEIGEKYTKTLKKSNFLKKY